MQWSSPVDGFRLAYERIGTGAAVVLLHGWPGDRTDYDDVVPLLADEADVIVPDLRGFGASDKHRADPASQYSAAAQARSVIGLMTELGLHRPVLAGYDIGSRIAQAIARDRPEAVSRLVISPPLPGIGERILSPAAQREFWYQAFHQLELASQLIDGRPEAVREYLRHFWSHWSGPDYQPARQRLDHLTAAYCQPGAFDASIGWYRSGAGSVAVSVTERPPSERVATPISVLWPSHDPLFPPDWSDRLDSFFTDVTLTRLEGSGHFTPAERPAEFAAAVTAAAHPIRTAYDGSRSS